MGGKKSWQKKKKIAVRVGFNTVLHMNVDVIISDRWIVLV